MAFGTIAVSIGSTTDAMEAVKSGTGLFGYVLMILFLCNIIGHNAMNLYGAVLSCITSIQTFAGQWMPSRNIRVVLSIIVLVLATLTALWASSNFISFFLNVIFALLFILVPWVSINLLDFYVVNKSLMTFNPSLHVMVVFTANLMQKRLRLISLGLRYKFHS